LIRVTARPVVSFRSGRRDWVGHRDQIRQIPEVLGGSGKEELIAGAAGSSEPQTVEPDNAFEVREQHLNLLPFTAKGLVASVLAISSAISRAPS
jgi:hypothetical protein